MDFRGKVVLITGASSGIGAGTAKHFARLGATLVLTGRNSDNLQKVASECECSTSNIPSAMGRKPLQLVAELADENDVKLIIEKTITTFGRLDVLINNAGIFEAGTIETTTLEQYDRIMNTNVRTLYHLTMLAIPHLVASEGNIVNVSSVNGLRSFAGTLAYCVSKSAVDQLTRCCALDLAPKRVRVNSVNPGVVMTEIHRRSGMGEEEYARFVERSSHTHALGRPGEVQEVAKTIAFLASDHASYITGACLPVDGGRHAMCPR